jgi:integrase
MNVLIRQIGDLPMKDVTPSDIKAVYNEYLGMSESTIKKAKMLYVDMWDCAIEDGIVRSNPCRAKGAKPHEGTSGSHRALSESEDELILTCPAPLRKAVLLMRYAGLRRGEAMAFNVDKCVDFDSKIIKVKEAVHFEGNKGVIVDPKTRAGIREIPLLAILENELKDVHGNICPVKKVKTVTSSSWRSMWLSYINTLECHVNNCNQKRWFHLTKDWKESHPQEWKYYQNLLKKDPEQAEEYRLRDWKEVDIRPHDLRISYCTMLRDNEVDIKLAIKWMGHADEKMILRIYDQPSKKRAERAVDNLNKNLETVLKLGQTTIEKPSTD